MYASGSSPEPSDPNVSGWNAGNNANRWMVVSPVAAAGIDAAVPHHDHGAHTTPAAARTIPAPTYATAAMRDRAAASAAPAMYAMTANPSTSKSSRYNPAAGTWANVHASGAARNPSIPAAMSIESRSATST